MNKRRLPQTAWHLLLVTLFGLPLVTPLLRWTAVPCTHDGHLHYHRIAALRYAWENGLPFTRWLPDLAFGYGYPFFIYREPVPLYAGLIPHLLGLPLPAAENLLYILAILAGGWFMCLWVRDIFGERAGIVSAVAYMAAPYVLIDALIRGNAPESVALPLFPLLLWLGRRWLLTGAAGYFIAAVLSLATLSLSHNISLLLFTPTLGVYLLVIGLIHRLGWRAIVGRLALLFGFGLGMTFFYSGGALLEMDQVTLQQSTATRNNDFHFNFASLVEIFSPVPAEDPTLINPPLPFRLGWVPSLLALLGLTSLFGKIKINDSRLKNKEPAFIINHQPSIFNFEQRGHILMMAVAAAVFLFLSLPQSLFLWENIPLVEFIQFPWRMVGRAALPVSFLAGVPFAGGGWRVAGGKPQETNRQPAGVPFSLFRFSFSVFRFSFSVFRFSFSLFPFPFFVSLVFLILETLPLLYPAICQEAPFPTINTVHQYEHDTGLVGVDPEGSYFPRTVQRRPKESLLEAAYQSGEIPQRFDTAVLPPNAIIHARDDRPLFARIEMTSPEPFTARYLSFDFPGWMAKVDGRSLPITPSDPDGLITFPVPEGEHTITVRWQSTPLRTILLGLSIMAMAGVAVTAVVLRKPLSVNRYPFTEHGIRNTEYTLLLTAVLVLAFKFSIVDKMETPLRRAGTPTVAYPAALQAAELRFDGYNLSQTRVESGETFDIDMAWTAVSLPAADYQSNVWLVGPEGLIWSEKGTERPRLYEDAPPTFQWPPGHWAWDSREVQVFTGTPPGRYDIVLTLFDKADLQPRTLLDENGAVVGPTAVIGQIEVTRPTELPELEMQFEMERETAVANLLLLGYNQDRAEATPGDPVLLTLFWEKPERPSGAPANFQIQLMDGQGTAVKTWPIAPVHTSYPPDAWQPGERLRGQHPLRLPASLDSGDYRFVLNGIALGKITIEAPDRLFEQPEVQTLVNVTFSSTSGTPLITLIGHTQLPITNNQLPITLLWQAITELPTSYRVFVHLVDANGQIIAQSDGEPAAWSRPTTGWMPGEYILDRHSLALPNPLPSGPLTLRAGLYDPATGQRLRTPTADFAELK